MNPTIAIIGLVVGVLTSLITLSYWVGKLSNKVDALEEWRANIRIDMHEISDITKKLAVEQATILERISQIKEVIDNQQIIERRKEPRVSIYNTGKSNG